MQQIKSLVDTKIIYLYDLPQKEYTSTKLAKIIHSKTGYHLENMPQVTRDLAKPFYSARIKIENQEMYKKVLDQLRYFEFEGHPCRGLPYQNNLLGVNVQKLAEHNLFVRKVPKHMHSGDLAKKFDQYEIISCKVSIDEKYNSKGYGFITFESEESAKNALNESQQQSEVIGVKYAPRGKTEFRRVFNNIFVKNLPQEWTEQQIREAFGVFGNITSVKNEVNNASQFAFICYGSTDVQDREYGFIAAKSAVHEMHNKEINGKPIYCSPALKKEDRMKEIAQESLKYKNSKRRLNLFVKGFAPTTREEDLRPFFEVYGPIESLRIIRPEDSTKPYAFVCYFTPDAASQAKNAKIEINNNAPLTIRLYELKEQRDLIKEAAEDLKGWQQYQSELAPQNEYKNIEQITSVIQMLMATMQKQGQNNQGMPGYQQNRGHSQPHHNGQYQNQNNNQGGYRNNNNYQGNQNRQNQVGQNNYGNRNQQHSQPRPQPMPIVQQMPIPAPMPQAPQAYQQQVQFLPSQDPMAQELYSKTLPIYAAITEINPAYKQVVGSTIFEFVTRLAGSQYAPKITGMLIDLPIVEIQRYVTNFDLFAQRIQQALQLLSQQTVAQ